MPVIANDRKVAVLLSAIGGEAIANTLSKLSDAKADSIRQAIDGIETNPPGDKERDEVLDEFEKFFRFAMETAHVPATWMQDMLDGENSAANDKHNSLAAEDDDAEDDELPDLRQPTLRIFQPTGDPYYDLRRLKPIQLARALRSEQPQTIALVMSHLSKEQTTEVVQHLPEKLQAAVILAIKNKPVAPEFVIERIVVETVRMAAGASDKVAHEQDINDQLAEMLRGMPKKNRARIMDEIRENNPQVADAISSRLYVFEDINTYDDRSIQKLLGEIDSATLIASLQDSADAIRDIVFSNLSKRARGAVMEEMELSPKSSADDVTQARDKIASAIARLDQDGQLNTR